MKLPSLLGIGNYFPKLKPARGVRKERPFSTAQIELTSRCSTGCVFCPHDALSDRWVQGDMPVELYRKHIAPHLALFDLVYLQGWGEPMLHPHLWEMLDMARAQGCKTGFTTNGSWLQGGRNEKLLDMGVDLISVSFAGTAAPVHESLRTNSQFAPLCRNFEALAALKKHRRCANPWLELHFLMTRANLERRRRTVASMASSKSSSETKLAPPSTMTTASRLAAKTKLMSLCSNCSRLGLMTNCPSIRPTRTAPMGP